MTIDLGNYTTATLDDFGDVTFEFDDNDISFEITLNGRELYELLGEFKENKKSMEYEFDEGVVVEVYGENTVEITLTDDEGETDSLMLDTEELLEHMAEWYD